MVRSLSVAVLLMATVPVVALEPKDVFLLVNKNMPDSKDVAEHYCRKRAVPVENIIVLDLPITEEIGREDYQTKIVGPLRDALKEKKDQAKVLLSIYGMPLRVAGQTTSKEEAAIIKQLEPEIKKHEEEIQALQSQVGMLDEALKNGPIEKLNSLRVETNKSLAAKQQALARMTLQKLVLSYTESHASVDSELMLLWWDKYVLARWQANLLHWQIPARIREGKPPVLMTCRLDGPTAAIAKGLVDQAVEVEKQGLKGKVYVDARGIRFDPTKEDGTQYGGYDESMREMASLLDKEGKLTVVLDDQEPLFKPGSCPDCALYCGWYSPAHFVDCCQFVPGAVAWHLASFEAISLRNTDTKQWCRCLLEKGVAATLGPVAEPYTIGFPKPEEFFGFLATGKYTLVECYSRTEMFCSWMTVLIGDPLYNPFGKNPKLKEEQVQPSPKGGRLFFNAK